MTLISTERLTALIQLLPERRFAELCNDLIALAAASGGLSRAHFDLTLNTSEPEGGLDARGLNVPWAVGRLIPAGDVGYQFKSGTQKKTATKVAREDIADKPSVMDLLERGGTFVYLAAWDRASKVEAQIRSEARKLGIDIKPEQLVFFTSHTIAQLLQAYPALIASFFGLEFHLLTLEQWAAHRPLTNPYQQDETVTTQLVDLRVMIERGGEPVRLVGAPGDGKTRLVLEALRGSSLAPTVLYSPQREYVTAALAGHLRSTEDTQCTLVVDEVDDAGAAELALLFASMPAGVRLVTIGQDAGPSRAGTVRVQGLSEDVLVQAITAIATGLASEVAREIARACHHSPKLAVLIAERVADQPDLALPHRMLADGQVQRTLDRYLGIDPTDPTWEALSTFALLQRVGWTEGVVQESEILFRAVGLEPRKARRLVEQVHLRTGIAPRANRFRYISPAILGDYLAARQLETWSETEVRTFLQSLTPAMARSFGWKVRRMAQVLENRWVVEEVVLGEHGPFRRLSDLEQSGLAALLPTFAAVFPHATLACLRRIMDSASDTELAAERAARRTLVQTVTDLLWRADTFGGSALLLLRLAANENETWANNATGTWKETFQIHLGRTAADPQARLRVLCSAIASKIPEERRLVAEALGQAVDVGHTSRTGGPPADVEGMPVEVWRPLTWGEWFTVLRSYFSMLGQLLLDTDAGVAVEAAKALRTGTRAAVRFPVTDEWIAAARQAIGAEYALRSQLLAGISDTIERHAGFQAESADQSNSDDTDGDVIIDPDIVPIAEERMERLQALAAELRDDTFRTRFRWAMEHEWHFGRRTDYAEEKDDELRSLMREAVAEPSLLDSEMKWLAGREHETGRWAHALGFVDRERKFSDRLLGQQGKSPFATGWITEYEVGYAAGGAGDEWIDRRVEELRAGGVDGEILVRLLYRGGASPSRAALLTELFESGAVSGAVLSMFVYTNWTELDEHVRLRLVEAATASGTAESLTAGIRFLAVTLQKDITWSEPLADLALGLVQRSHDPSITRQAADDWAEVALTVVEKDPAVIAAATLRQLSQSSLRDEDDLLPVLKRAWELGDKRALFLELIGPSVMRHDEIGWQLRSRLEHFDLSALDFEVLTTWIDEDPETRSNVIAEIVGVPLGKPTDLHAMLLDRYEVHGVGSAFFGGLISGTHWGSHAGWLLGKREQAQQWSADARPAVRAWAVKVVQSIDGMIERERKREEEEAIRWL
jgi:hypothetical protein